MTRAEEPGCGQRSPTISGCASGAGTSPIFHGWQQGWRRGPHDRRSWQTTNWSEGIAPQLSSHLLYGRTRQGRAGLHPLLSCFHTPGFFVVSRDSCCFTMAWTSAIPRDSPWRGFVRWFRSARAAGRRAATFSVLCVRIGGSGVGGEQARALDADAFEISGLDDIIDHPQGARGVRAV